MLGLCVTGKVTQNATHRKGYQMRYRAMFIAGLAVGFVLGARAGRERYEQIVKYSQQVAGHPAVQKVTQTVTTKTTEYTKTAMSKAPDLAKTAGAQVPKLVGSAKSRLGGKGEDGTEDDVSADGHLVYPADGADASVNGARYNAD
jgi:hypothetical protein